MTGATENSVLAAVEILENHSLLWEPAYLDKSVGVPQVPLAFWFMDLLRPRKVVSLGGGSGVIHAAVCQAAKALALECDCYFHLSQPPGEAFMRHCTSEYSDYSMPLLDLASIPDAGVDFISVHVGDSQRVGEIDWASLRAKMSDNAIMLIYGDALESLPRLAYSSPDNGHALRLGAGSDASHLIFSGNPPGAMLDLLDEKSGTTKKSSLLKLLARQTRLQDLRYLTQFIPPLMPDPTAPEFPTPETLEEAKSQIGRLIEIHAEDLEVLAERLKEKDEVLISREAERDREISKLKAEMARKDEILDQLNLRLGELAQERSTEVIGGSAHRKGFLRRILRSLR